MTGTLIGREAESARLRELLTHGGTVVVRAAAGLGKTALLHELSRTATTHRVLRLPGLAAEAGLPYAAVHLLCSTLPEFPELPGRELLERAMGLRPGPAPERLAVCAAVLDLLKLAARDQPLLCVVDDAQWWDEESAAVFAAVAPRLAATTVALVFAETEEQAPSEPIADRAGAPASAPERFARLPSLPLRQLGHADAREVLAHACRPLDDAVGARIVAEARGNPRRLLEAAGSVTAGGYGVVPLSCPELAATAATLTPAGRLLFVLAAAEPLGDPARLWRAARRLGLDADDAAPLEAAGLVEFGPWITFREPRLRQCAYGLASAAHRRLVHGVLALATEPHREPDRRAWHLAHATIEPAEALADDLERLADDAGRRGGLPAAAAFRELATLRTADAGLRAERAVAAADAHHAAGAVDSAVRLLAVAELGALDAAGRARAERLRARMAFDAGRGGPAVGRLLTSAQELEVSEPRLARPAYLEALGAAIFTGHVDVVHAVLTRLAGRRPTGSDRLLEGVAQRCTAGYAAAVEPLKLALKTLDNDHGTDARSRLLACLVAADLQDDETWHDLTHAELDRARASGARTILPYVLTHRALAEVHFGRFGTAESLVAEAEALTRLSGAPDFPHAAGALAAWRGRELPEASACAENAGLAHALSRYATAVLHNGLGDYSEAADATREFLDRDGIELAGWSLVELVEAAARSGDRSTAIAAAERVSERACLSGTDWALGADARSRALLADGEAAETLYAEAIDRLGRSLITPHLARARLLYGEWLRRRGRRVDARGPLRAAHEAFAGLGAEAFADRTHRELLATGERARRRVAETRSQLTPQECRIAALARDGRSNPDIATALSISPRTVEYHLHKVFTKLSITSRTELHLVLTAGES
ncbi:AAA family ATPase [Amycolatopsis rhabdoformis]|uniref:AAA family ATPase n=1 Tax=Amycolatopsis rhabdoformis TaxID=1448059 RepID=A0ABZ1IFI0_9PSEU|nr:AAA family ATPase [Amycolatopsis rhabdoformis]WSE32687.1 AAA family ATPase [Amycolatopsis rhabdoformis]